VQIIQGVKNCAPTQVVRQAAATPITTVGSQCGTADPHFSISHRDFSTSFRHNLSSAKKMQVRQQIPADVAR
jgi:hypothetical protein